MTMIDTDQIEAVTFVAFSGGKDSTAMVLEMHRRTEQATLLFTPAWNEPPEVFDHINHVQAMVGWPLVKLNAPTLRQLMWNYNALPNHRQRWCTRQIKIEPCIAELKRHKNPTLCVGLRADEGEREGLYGDYATYRYPLREWGWGHKDCVDACRCFGVTVPQRTDCLFCYGQRIGEWYRLWRDRPESFSEAEAWEYRTGHTFRSPSRDTWPAALKDLRCVFEGGRIPRDASDDNQLALFDDDDVYQPCRVCRL